VIIFTLVALMGSLSPTIAGDRPDRNYEVFAGADVASSVFWLAYTGATLAPFGDIHETGLRLRVSGGYGRYTYHAHSAANGFELTSFHAQTSYAEALVGYLQRLGALTVKGFVGVSGIEHDIRPLDGANRAQGLEVGAKAVAEFWLNIGETGWASLDLSWSQAHNTRSGRTRVGYRILPHVSLGLEGGLNMDRQGSYKISDEATEYRSDALDFARIGAFARYDWSGGEISASGGLLGDFTEERSAYATINWISQF